MSKPEIKAYIIQQIGYEWLSPLKAEDVSLLTTVPFGMDESPPPRSLSDFVTKGYIHHMAKSLLPILPDVSTAELKGMKAMEKRANMDRYGMEDPHAVLLQLDLQLIRAAKGEETGYDPQILQQGYLILDKALQLTGKEAARAATKSQGPADDIMDVAEFQSLVEHERTGGPVSRSNIDQGRKQMAEWSAANTQAYTAINAAMNVTAALADQLGITLPKNRGTQLGG